MSPVCRSRPCLFAQRVRLTGARSSRAFVVALTVSQAVARACQPDVRWVNHVGTSLCETLLGRVRGCAAPPRTLVRWLRLLLLAAIRGGGRDNRLGPSRCYRAH